MPGRQQVSDWNIAKLSEWAAELEADALVYENQLGRMLTHFGGTTWSGKAHDAAADRFTEENTQGQRLSQEIRDIATALRAADVRLSGERSALFGRVGDAEHDPESLLPLRVDDKWVVSATYTRHDLSAKDTQKVQDRIVHHQGLINAAYYSLDNAVSEAAAAITAGAQEVRARGDLIGDGVDAPNLIGTDSWGLGYEDGQALAEWAATFPETSRDDSVLERIAGNLPQHVLTEEQLRILSEGGEIDSLPESVQQYYRALYDTAGKDGILGLSEHLKTQENAGNTEAAGQLDSLGNGLAIISNEDIGTGRNPNGELTNPGTYQNVPPEFRALIEAKHTEEVPGLEPGEGPTVARQEQWEQTNALAALIGESNPGYEPGTELGTKMYLKAEDMVEDPSLWPGRDDAAATFAEVAGRNDDSGHQIWTGEGLPDDYNPQETVRALTGYDWSQNGASAQGAATLIERVTEESQLPPETELGMRGRAALKDFGDMFAPDGDDEVFGQQSENFAKNPELSTAMSKALAANLEAVSQPGQQTGYMTTEVTPDGQVRFRSEAASQLLQLGGYSDEGRLNLTTAVEQHRIDELTRVLSENPGDVENHLASSDVGELTGRIDKAIWGALHHQDELTEEKVTNPDDGLYTVKKMAADLVGGLVDDGIGKVPGGEVALAPTGIDGDGVTGAIEDWITPEYEPLERPDDLQPEAQKNAYQAILQSAFAAGQLPPNLHNGVEPYNISAILRNETDKREFLDFLTERGLNQYVKDYNQSYAINLG